MLQGWSNMATAKTSKWDGTKTAVSTMHYDVADSGDWSGACGEKVEKLINYEGDIRNLHDFGFDAVKLDGCGRQRNLTLC